MPNCRPSLDNGVLLRVGPGKQTLYWHVALLDENRMSSSANGIHRAMIVRKLQRDHGTEYVQRLIEHISRRRATQVRAGITSRGTRHDDAARLAPSQSA